MDMSVAQGALDPKPGGAHGFQVRPTGDEGYLGAGIGQAGAEIPANAAGTHDGETQGGRRLIGHRPIITRRRAPVNALTVVARGAKVAAKGRSVP
jgi:hypothetical protein